MLVSSNSGGFLLRLKRKLYLNIDLPFQYLVAFGSRIWNIFVVYKLVQISRQRDDLSFAIALNNMAIGEMTSADMQLFQSRVLQVSASDLKALIREEAVFSHLDEDGSGGDINMEYRAICLFYTNNMVRNMNAAILENMTTEGAISAGFDRIIGVCSNRSAVEHLLASVANDSVH